MNNAATGAHTTNGLPHGRTSLTPHIVVERAAEAIEFYRDVLGATVASVTEMAGVIAHAELELAAGFFTLSAPIKEYELAAPGAEGAVSYSLALYVTNVDDVVSKAVEAGATLREPVATFVSGDRFGSLLDPFGVRWAIMTRVEDLSPEESARRVEEWAKAQEA